MRHETCLAEGGWKMSKIPILAIIFLLEFLGGCASTSRDKTLDEMGKSAADQSGYQVQWNTSITDSGEISEEVRKLLQDNLNADIAVQIALANNRHLQATFEELGIAHTTLVQAQLPDNPALDASVRFLEDGAGEVINFALTENVLSLLLIPSKKSLAREKMDAAMLKVACVTMDLALEARTAFYAYQSAEQFHEMRKSILNASEASYDMAQRIHKAGNMTDLDLANERALYEQSKLDLSAAETEAAEARERVNAVLGLWGKDIEWKSEKRMPEIPDKEPGNKDAEKTAIAKSLDLKLARKQLEITAQKYGITKTELTFPDLSIGVESEKSETEVWSHGPALTVTLPLFNRGQALKPAAEAELRREWKEYLALAVEIRSETRTAVYRMKLARQQALYYMNVMLPLRNRITNETQQRYNAMLVGVFELLQAKQHEIEAGAHYIRELQNYWIARAELEQILSGRILKSSPHRGLLPVIQREVFGEFAGSREND